MSLVRTCQPVVLVDPRHGGVRPRGARAGRGWSVLAAVVDRVGRGEARGDVAGLPWSSARISGPLADGSRLAAAILHDGRPDAPSPPGIEDRGQQRSPLLGAAALLRRPLRSRRSPAAAHALPTKRTHVVQHVRVVGVDEAGCRGGPSGRPPAAHLPGVDGVHAWDWPGLPSCRSRRCGRGVRGAQQLGVQQAVHRDIECVAGLAGDDPGPKGGHAPPLALAGLVASTWVTPRIASSMARSPVQRQRLPFSAAAGRQAAPR